MALRVIMKGKANSVEEAKRFISNNHGPEPRYIKEDKEQDGKIWLSNQLGDPIGFYEPATKIVKMIDKKTTDADIKFVNKGQKFKNNNGAIVEVISDVDKLGQVTFKIKAPTQTFPDSKTVKVDGLINMLNKNGYIPTKDAPYFDPMYKDTRRAVVKEAENYLRSKGLNNSVGKYDKAIFGVRNLLEKTLLQPGTDKFNEAVHREVDRLLKKYNLTKDSTNYSEVADGKLKYKCMYMPLYPPFKLKTMIIQAASKEEAESLWEPGKKYGGYGKLKSIASYGHNVDKKTVDSEAKDREPLTVIAEKNGYGLAVNEKGILVLKFPGESYSNPHMYLGKYNGPWDTNYGKALNMFEKFAKIKAKDAANGSVDDYLKKMNNKTQAEVEKILKQAKGNPNADKAYKIWKSTVKDEEPKTYSYSIKIGGDLKKIRVKANNSDEALAKVKAEAIKFKADRVKTKWDNNKLSTRDQD